MVGERTEQPTQKRRQDARRRGQVAVSREVDTAISLFAAFMAFRLLGPRVWNGLQQLMAETFAEVGSDPLHSDLAAALGTDLVWRSVMLLIPLVAMVGVFGVLSGVLQTGGVFSLQAIKPQPSRVSPLKGAKRVFASKQGLVQLAKGLLKFAIIGGVAYLTLRDRWAELSALGIGAPLGASLETLLSVAFELVLRVVVALVVLAVADLLFQRYDMAGQLRMTRQEVKEELRQSEGDPAMRSAIVRQRQSFMARVMQAVPQADVVLTNPTRYAVALKYDPASSHAPVVVAKGERLIAQRIRELAIEHDIPVIQNPPLTRAIYRAVPVGREITAELYEAVAEILAFVYRLRYPRARAVA